MFGSACLRQAQASPHEIWVCSASDKLGLGIPSLPTSDELGSGIPGSARLRQAGFGHPQMVCLTLIYVGCQEHILVPEDVASCHHRLLSFVEDVGKRVPEANVALVWRGVLQYNRKVT